MSERTAMQKIIQLLAEKAGIDSRSLDAKHLDWVVQSRSKQVGVVPEDYISCLLSSHEEVESLIDAVVVRETRFFRDPAVFQHLQAWLPRMAEEFSGELKILSAPCSTGQEAYSIAAACVMAGIPASRFSIDAFDISPTALAIARRGHYPIDALRALPLDVQRACGTLHDMQWTMHETLRRRIRFEQRNLAEPDALTREALPYHLIFCRNLFIYLHAEARATLARSLGEMLVPGGRLILGSADRVEEIGSYFTSIKPAASFAFTHRSTQETIRLSVARRKISAPNTARIGMVATAIHAAVTASSKTETAEELHARALQHYERHEFRKAEKRCRQALYLDPQYLPALELLELLWKQHPNLRLRRALHARIRRHVSANTHKETA